MSEEQFVVMPGYTLSALGPTYVSSGHDPDSVAQNLGPILGWLLSCHSPQDITIDPLFQGHNPFPTCPFLLLS